MTTPAGHEWHITCELVDRNGERVLTAGPLRWSDSYVSTYHPSHLGQAIQGYMAEAWNRAVPKRKPRGARL